MDGRNDGHDQEGVVFGDKIISVSYLLFTAINSFLY